MHFAVTESGASDDDLGCTPGSNLRGASHSPDAATDAHLHAEIFSRTLAEFANGIVVLAFSHGGVQVDDVQPGILLEFLQEAEDVSDGEFALSAMNQLNCQAALQVDAGNQHGRRTSTPRAARNSFSVRMDCNSS